MLVRPEAEQDMRLAFQWYERRRAGLGGEFLDEIAAALGELERDPQRPGLYFGRFRRVLLGRFPYKVFYQVMGDRVVIFRILHAKQEHQDGLTDELGLR